MKFIDNFALKVAKFVIDSMHGEMNLIRAKIIEIANNVKPLPAYITLEAPDGRAAVSEIVYLLPGQSSRVSIRPFQGFSKGSVFKVSYPMFMYQLTIGLNTVLKSDEQSCMTCKADVNIDPCDSITAIIRYVK